MPPEKGAPWRDSSDDNSEQQEAIFNDLSKEQADGFEAAAQGITLGQLIALVGGRAGKEVKPDEEEVGEREEVTDKQKRRCLRAFAGASDDGDHVKRDKKRTSEVVRVKVKAKATAGRATSRPASRTPA
eukprot:4300814-Pyramimonas_sp.AAC.1